jgi:predicted nucleotidyltransferase
MTAQGLTEKEWELMKGVFARHPEVSGVIVFGSRAKGNSTAASDIDLAVEGIDDPLQAEALAGELDELPLPYAFSLVRCGSTSSALVYGCTEAGRSPGGSPGPGGAGRLLTRGSHGSSLAGTPSRPAPGLPNQRTIRADDTRFKANDLVRVCVARWVTPISAHAWQLNRSRCGRTRCGRGFNWPVAGYPPAPPKLGENMEREQEAAPRV